jgi:predicted AAA+ superfamily ATPase
MYKRQILQKISDQVKKGKSILLLGPRQVGKTTLCRSFKFDLEINFSSVSEKLKHEKDPTLLEKLIVSSRKKLLVYIDEIQKVPLLFDSIQHLIDTQKAQFVLTGSSTRKIKQQSEINFAPGRLIVFRLDPFSFAEKADSLENILAFGQLPRISIEDEENQKELELSSYVETYIEEEIRKETRLRSVAPFSRFLELAALQSGKISNFSEISKELGPTVVTIQSYFQILEDTLFVERVDPYLLNSNRKKLTKSSRYLFFDLGVRRILSQEGRKFTPDRKGEIFEHWIGNEIIKWVRQQNLKAKLFFWRDPDGPEVDWILSYDGHLLPIEVKLSSSPKKSAIKHLKVFLDEYPKARSAIIVCTTTIKFKLDTNIEAISFKNLSEYLNNWVKSLN